MPRRHTDVGSAHTRVTALFRRLPRPICPHCPWPGVRGPAAHGKHRRTRYWLRCLRAVRLLPSRAPPSSPTNPLQRGKFTWVVARQPSDELAIGQQPCDQSREHNALKYSEPLCAAVFCDSRGATQAHLQLQTRRCHERRSACVAEDRAQGRLYRMEPGLGPRCGKRQRDRVLPPDTCALRVTYPHNADSILESLARSPRMARDG